MTTLVCRNILLYGRAEEAALGHPTQPPEAGVQDIIDAVIIQLPSRLFHYTTHRRFYLGY